MVCLSSTTSRKGPTRYLDGHQGRTYTCNWDAFTFFSSVSVKTHEVSFRQANKQKGYSMEVLVVLLRTFEDLEVDVPGVHHGDRVVVRLRVQVNVTWILPCLSPQPNPARKKLSSHHTPNTGEEKQTCSCWDCSSQRKYFCHSTRKRIFTNLSTVRSISH